MNTVNYLPLLKFRIFIAEVFRPLLFLLPKGHGVILRLILTKNYASPKTAAEFAQLYGKTSRIIFDRRLNSYVILDMLSWACRFHYYTGRYHEQVLQTAIETKLKPADVFIDIGANRGLHTLKAANYLTYGQVYSFEPNPSVFKILEAHLLINDVINTRCWNIGLADENTTLTLNILEKEHSGSATFRKENQSHHGVTIPVKRFDDLELDLPNNDGQQYFVKIDTEGYDHQVIKGMLNFLSRPNVMVWSEVTDEWLKNTGSSATELFADMQKLGYTAYLPKLRLSPYLKYQIEFEELKQPLNKFQYDVFFQKK